VSTPPPKFVMLGIKLNSFTPRIKQM